MVLVQQRSFDDLGTSLFDVTFCVLDLETTGGSPKTDAITEIGAVKTRRGEIVGQFQTLVNPGLAIPPFITVLTGITQTMVVEAPRIEQVLPSFLEFCAGTVIVGHNVRFDMGFLDAACDQLSYERLDNPRVDTAALARRLIRREVRNLKLATLAGYLRSPIVPNHRAFEDAGATMHVLWGLLERAAGLGVTALEDLLALPRAKGSAHYHKIHLAKELPRRPGVYLFKDRHGEVIYVGKAKNLRTRVASYFYGDTRRSIADLIAELDTVDYHTTAGELEAAITEVRLIHAHRPRHNRASRPPRSNHWVTLTNETFPRLSLTRTLRPDALAVLGPFRSRRAAETVMTAIWDAVPVRRCTARPGTRSSKCAPAQMGAALCPCDGSLPEDRYRPVVSAVIAGMTNHPEVLLDPLERRMRLLAGQQRYEEAAWARDRHSALGRAIEARRRWQALRAANWVEMESIDGERVLVRDGRFVCSWRAGSPAPLIAGIEPSEAVDSPPVPPTVAAAEELRLIWNWTLDMGAILIDSGSPLQLPASPVTRLSG